MSYTPQFEKEYEGGWEDFPSEDTLITAHALNMYDDTFEHIEEYLSEGGGGASALSDLTDVNIVSPTDGQAFVYNGASQKWKNGKLGDIKEYEQTGFLSRNLMKATENGQNINGLTFVKNDDGSYTVNGTATARTFQRVTLLANCGLENGKQYRLTGVPITNNNYAVGIDSIGRGNPLYDFTNDTSLTSAYVYIMVENGATCNNMVFKPMITLNMAAQYDDFTPYAKSNTELGSEIDSIRNYSTQEKVVGEWIDGKPLYQKTFVTTSASQINTSTTAVDLTSYNIENIVVQDGFIKTANNITPHGGQSFILWYRESDKTISHQVTNNAYLSSPLYITIQYTKTTD